MKPTLQINSRGDKFYTLHGSYHRDDGPAIIFNSGSKVWYQYGKRHRLDGPAYEGEGMQFWYFNDKVIDCSSQKEFEKLLKVINFKNTSTLTNYFKNI
jgi:hypothetical protein